MVHALVVLVRAGMIVALLLASGRLAHADARTPSTEPAWLVDGGAVPLFWLPAAVDLSLDRIVRPRATPLFFDPNDGGASVARWEIPDWTLYAAGIGVGGAFALGNDPTRWYHVKGLAESMATSGLVMTVLKDVVGRHRPDWAVDSADATKDQSFPSGHTTEAFAIATYAALYIHDHVFGGPLTLGHGLAYTGVFAVAGMVAVERVYHHRHHVSDVVVGAAIGAVTSALIYRYQQHQAVVDSSRAPEAAAMPDGRAPLLSFGAAF
jgi:membrane-associated phospholipid phosphatase